MSRTPLPQWMYPASTGQHPDAKSHAAGDDQHMFTAHPNQFNVPEEPPRFLYPETQVYEPSYIPAASNSRVPYHGRPWDSVADPKYNFSPGPPVNTGAPAQYGVQRSNVMRSVEYGSASALVSSPYQDSSSYSRGSIGSISGTRANDVESQYSSSSATFPSPVHSDESSAIYPAIAPPMKPLAQPNQRHTTSSMPSGFERLLHHSPTPSPPPRRTSTASRYHLLVRQQPIAARACGAGDRDRRPVDPPPIIQLLLTDFDPKESDDIDILQDPRFTVGCFLVPETRGSFSDLDGDSALREDRLGTAPGQSTPLLAGKSFVSPFFVDEDPDPTTAPTHPSTFDYMSERRMQLAPSTNGARQPAAFFIFSDLSVRTAGRYRLQFRLMNWGLVEDTGQSMPVLAEAWSDPFRVFPAKDFPGMRDSSRLTEGLKELGFVELKTRGKNKGKGKRK
ncbi:velvet factor protein [Aspergillus sclerotioniger CBS 115572]|uniref:Velvet factor protein n=1 Tax=Aspergillus sclerotioniger CBS 115572 TaxID=1450535 RepID=A0A317WL95_9EURO|nr:velvet factor protein [Aspergillus sclerotioniger CBS 115572]PWY87163.1 velvet factor protein [Aspergillus sclerotioniger CBS 115572]